MSIQVDDIVRVKGVLLGEPGALTYRVVHVGTTIARIETTTGRQVTVYLTSLVKEADLADYAAQG